MDQNEFSKKLFQTNNSIERKKIIKLFIEGDNSDPDYNWFYSGDPFYTTGVLNTSTSAINYGVGIVDYITKKYPSYFCNPQTSLEKVILKLTIFDKKIHPKKCPCCSVNFNNSRADKNIIITTPCNHVIHQKCIREWLATTPKPTCPICRHNF